MVDVVPRDYVGSTGGQACANPERQLHLPRFLQQLQHVLAFLGVGQQGGSARAAERVAWVRVLRLEFEVMVFVMIGKISFY